MLAKYPGTAKSPIYYIVGPPGMVNALHSMAAVFDQERQDRPLGHAQRLGSQKDQ
jgi:hypothetical protein